jgi:hypothetical protein
VCIWQPTILRIQGTAASLVVIDRRWLPTCLIKALLGGGRENSVILGSLSVVSRECDESSALQYFRDKNSELVHVTVFRCLNQVGRKCEDSVVFWNRYEATSKFVFDVIPWNQEHICEIAPEALENMLTRQPAIWRKHENCRSQEQMIKEVPEALEKLEMRSNSVYSISIKPRSQDHIRDIALEALEKCVARPTLIWRHDKSCLSQEHVDHTTPKALIRITRRTLPQAPPPRTRRVCL